MSGAYISGIFGIFTRYLKENIPLFVGIFSKENRIVEMEDQGEKVLIKTEKCHNLKEGDDAILTNIYSIITSSHIKFHNGFFIISTDQVHDFTFGMSIEDIEERTFVVSNSPWVKINNLEKKDLTLKIFLDRPDFFKKGMVIKIVVNKTIEFYDFPFDIISVESDHILVDFPFENLTNFFTDGEVEIQNSPTNLFLKDISNIKKDLNEISLKQKISLYYNGYQTIKEVLDEYTVSVSKKEGNLGKPVLNEWSCIRTDNRIVLDSGIENFIKSTKIKGNGKANCKLIITPDMGKISYDRNNKNNDAIATSFDGGDQYLTYVKDFTVYLVIEKQEAVDFSREINIANNFLKFLNNVIMNYTFVPLTQNNTTSGVVFIEEGEYVDPTFKLSYGNSLYVHTYSYQYTEQYLLTNSLDQIDYDRVYQANNQYLTLQKIFDYLKLDTDIRKFFDVTVGDSRKNMSTTKIRRITNNTNYKGAVIENESRS